MIINRTSRHSVVAAPTGGARVSASVREHEVLTDQPTKLGGTDTAPSPLELLSVSLASCIALYVGRYCEAEALETEGVAVEVKPFWRENPGRVARFDVVLHIPQTIPARFHAAIEEVARKCPVHHTLVHAPEITMQLLETPAMEGAAG